MITLCMDTSHVFLALSIIRDNEVIAKIQETCWKRQSEEIFPKLQELLGSCDLQPEDIEQIVVTKGPGSYTGVRIAMTVAKVFCAMKNIPIYTVGTLQLFAGMQDHVHVILDARGHRVYSAIYEKGNLVSELCVKDLDEVDLNDHFTGDLHLIGKEDEYPDLADSFLSLKPFWEKADNVHFVKPEYLKSTESYLVKK